MGSKKQPQNSGFQVCSYSVIYHLGISATALSAAALMSRSPFLFSLGRAASTAAELPERLLHSTATGCGSAGAAREYWTGSQDCLQVVACALMAAVTR